MSDQLNEFAINLPMTGVSAVAPVAGIEALPAPAPAPVSYDCTADVSVPAEVKTDEHKHISVYADSCSVVNVEGPCAMIDVVLSVNITNPTTYACSTYKIVKRLSLDKIKLALQAEHMTPVQVVEAEEQPEDPLIVEQEMASYATICRARELAGIYESNGKLDATVLFKYTGKDNTICSGSVVYKYVENKAHARHVFDAKIDRKRFPDAKIVRVTLKDPAKKA